MSPIGAEEFIEEFLLKVRPPKGVAIALREREPDGDPDTNWVTVPAPLTPDATARYESAVAELRLRYPRIEWDGVTDREGKWRRIARWLSEGE